MTGARLARLKRKLDRWFWARHKLLLSRVPYRYVWDSGRVFDDLEQRALDDDEVLELPWLDLWEERIA